MLDALRAELPPGRVLVDPDLVAGYAHDEAGWASYGRPAAVVRPVTEAEVQVVVRHCAEHGVPIVPRGAGTGLSGGANAVDGCVLLSLEAMDAIVAIDPLEQLAVVQPGVVNDRLREAAAGHGLWYPPDPASSPWSTIGGNVATDAGGLCCVKYGVTSDYVLELRAVVGRGDAVRLGRRTAKGVAGYDLAALFAGSEGTLGVITEVTVRLRPLRRTPERTVVGYFDRLVAAGEAVAAVGAAGITPSALELVDRFCLRAVDEWKNMGLDVGGSEQAVLLLARSDLPGEAGEAEADALLECFERAGACYAARSTDATEAEALFAARRLAGPAMFRLGPVLTEDVCVPRHLVPAMLARVEEAATRHGVRIANLAHAGDGNLHPLILLEDGKELPAQRAFEEIVDGAIALGGTVTGEHGVGLLKRRGLHAELGPVVIGMHRAVKEALDPAGIFNPGKVFGDPGASMFADAAVGSSRAGAARAGASVREPGATALGIGATAQGIGVAGATGPDTSDDGVGA